MAFFLEATFVGLFFFGWDRLSKVGHLVVTWLVALGTNLSALWILIANGWMQYPVGAHFNPDTMRMEVTDFVDGDLQSRGAGEVRPHGQRRLCHRLGLRAGDQRLVPAARAAISSFAKRSMTVAASFGLASALSVVVLGDESGYTAGENQKMKIAAIEAMWDTEPAPAAFTVFGIPDMAAHTTHYAIKIPWVLGLIATRSIDTGVPGINELVADYAEHRIQSGMIAYDALAEDPQPIPHDARPAADFDAHVGDLGYALLLKRYRPRCRRRHDRADRSRRPGAPCPMCRRCSGRFRIMVGFGLLLHRLLRLRLLALDRRAASTAIAGSCGSALLILPAALDRRRARLVRRRGRPPALDRSTACCRPSSPSPASRRATW